MGGGGVKINYELCHSKNLTQKNTIYCYPINLTQAGNWPVLHHLKFSLHIVTYFKSKGNNIYQKQIILIWGK